MRVTLALFSAGLATFALLYCVQPILPVLSQDFGVSPAESSLSLSVSTGLLAIGLMFTGPLSDAIGRKSVMVVALLLAAVCTLICAFMTSWHGILLMRALIGLSLSGVAAVGMTYLSEEIHPSFVAFSMGLYISGNSIGGMSGRPVTGVLTDFFSARIARGHRPVRPRRRLHVLAHPARLAAFSRQLAAPAHPADQLQAALAR